MKYRQIIEVSGRLSADVFNLPCVRSAKKGNDGKVYYELNLAMMRRIFWATVCEGQMLCEDEDGFWSIEGEPLKKTKR
jgi:hypothetical protein